MTRIVELEDVPNVPASRAASINSAAEYLKDGQPIPPVLSRRLTALGVDVGVIERRYRQ